MSDFEAIREKCHGISQTYDTSIKWVNGRQIEIDIVIKADKSTKKNLPKIFSKNLEKNPSV